MGSGQRLVAIVDDDHAVCRALARLIRSLGFEAEVYGSGEALLDGVTTSHNVLLDLHMPGLHGPELVAELLHRHPSIKVIVMTGLDRPGEREASLSAGASAYVTKPIQRSELERLLASDE